MAVAPAPARSPFFSWSVLFLVASAICFVITLLLDLKVLKGSSINDWRDGGFLALVLSFLLP